MNGKEDDCGKEGSSECKRDPTDDPQPSTSSGATGARKKDQTQRKIKKKRGRGGKTSTPNKVQQEPRSMAPRITRNQRKRVSKEELEAAKSNLDEGRFVELSQDSSEESPVGSDMNQAADSESEIIITHDEDNNMVLSVEEESLHTGIEFETLSSSVLEEMKLLLSDSSGTQESVKWDGSDPNITRFLIGLAGDDESKITNPFDLADRVRREMIARAEETGARALDWDVSQFDKIGGRGTMVSVWKDLKSDERIGGRKRGRSWSSCESEIDKKKAKVSLNMSSTCSRMAELELSADREASLSASTLDSSRSSTDQENRRLFQVPDIDRLSSVGSDRSSVLDRELREMNWFEDNGHYLSSQPSNFSDLTQSVIWSENEDNELNSSREINEFENDGLYLSSQLSSLPDLTESDAWSDDEDNEASSGRDSGVSDSMGGNITNLCRNHRDYSVRRGIITETGPVIPVSLGISNGESDGSWEEVLDENGYATGVERKSFRINVVDGETDSINDEDARELRECGIGDRVNRRWRVDDQEVYDLDLNEEYNEWGRGGNEVPVMGNESSDSSAIEDEVSVSASARATLMSARVSSRASTRATLMSASGSRARTRATMPHVFS